MYSARVALFIGAIVLACAALTGFAAASETKSDSTGSSSTNYDRWLALWMGYTGYNMSEFNKFSSSDEYYGGFPAIEGGLTYALEISMVNVKLGDIPIVDLTKISIPVMIEYYSPDTRRESPTGARWNLPVFALALGSVVRFDNRPIPDWIAIRPSIGYYQLGFWGIDAKLEENYVSGARKLSGRTFGGQMAVRMEIQKSPLICAELGYRWVNFKAVSVVSSGEWLEWDEEGEIPFMIPIDLGGPFVRFGFGASW